MSEIITLDINSPPVQYLCKKDKRLAKVISMVGPITYTTRADEPYAFLIHEVIEQMLSAKAGARIYERLVALCDGCVTPSAIMILSDEELKSTGTSINKVRCIRSLTDSVTSGFLDLDKLQLLTDDEVIEELTRIKGIGQWTAKMFLIFVLNRDDVLPYEDVAFLQAFKWLYKTPEPSRDSVKKKCHKWKPYSSVAARFMYRALDTGLTKETFHLHKEDKNAKL